MENMRNNHGAKMVGIGFCAVCLMRMFKDDVEGKDYIFVDGKWYVLIV